MVTVTAAGAPAATPEAQSRAQQQDSFSDGGTVGPAGATTEW